MCPSYVRIKLPIKDALARFAEWNGIPEIEKNQEIHLRDAFKLAADENGHWRGATAFVSTIGDWTLFQDFSGALNCRPVESWKLFAKSDEMVFARYNDSIVSADLVIFFDGKLVREFRYLKDHRNSKHTEEIVDQGRLDSRHEPFKSWIQVASFVDSDDLGFSDRGLLWIFHPVR